MSILYLSIFLIQPRKMVIKVCEGTIISREGQIIAYADDVVIISRMEAKLKEIFTNLNEKAR